MSANNKMSRSAHRSDDWRRDARCSKGDLDPDLWDSDQRGGGGLAAAIAAHICLTHCPVRDRCLDDAIAAGTRRRAGVILGGVAFDHFGRPTRRQDTTESCQICTGMTVEGIRQERRRAQWREGAARKASRAA